MFTLAGPGAGEGRGDQPPVGDRVPRAGRRPAADPAACGCDARRSRRPPRRSEDGGFLRPKACRHGTHARWFCYLRQGACQDGAQAWVTDGAEPVAGTILRRLRRSLIDRDEPRRWQDVCYPAHISATPSHARTTASAVVRVSARRLACATSIRSNGSLWRHGRAPACSASIGRTGSS